jgi:hypothetical protein
VGKDVVFTGWTLLGRSFGRGPVRGSLSITAKENFMRKHTMARLFLHIFLSAFLSGWYLSAQDDASPSRFASSFYCEATPGQGQPVPTYYSDVFQSKSRPSVVSRAWTKYLIEHQGLKPYKGDETALLKVGDDQIEYMYDTPHCYFNRSEQGAEDDKSQRMKRESKNYNARFVQTEWTYVGPSDSDQ